MILQTLQKFTKLRFMHPRAASLPNCLDCGSCAQLVKAGRKKTQILVHSLPGLSGEPEDSHTWTYCLNVTVGGMPIKLYRAGQDIMKQEATEKVLVALRRILSGEIYVSDRIADSMLRHYVRGANASEQSSVSDLTDRELEVFRLIGEGRRRNVCSDFDVSLQQIPHAFWGNKVDPTPPERV
jgi:hypothetical protein